MSVPPFKELVKTLAFSNLAYMDQLEEISEVLGLPKLKFICGVKQHRDSQSYVLFKNRTCYVIFRGTESTQDMVNDVEAVRLDSIAFNPDIHLHHGFYLQYQAVEDELHDYLTEHHLLYDEIVFCGHSLGGALATIATEFYYYKNMDETNPNRTKHSKTVKVQTFGCPRVGNKAFSDYFQKCVKPENHWRVFNEIDPAAQFPSQTAIFSNDIYVHVAGNALCIVGESKTNPAVTFTVGLDDNHMNLPVTFMRKISQHHTAVYMNRLLKIINPPPPVLVAVQTDVEVSGKVTEKKMNDRKRNEEPSLNSPTNFSTLKQVPVDYDYDDTTTTDVGGDGELQPVESQSQGGKSFGHGRFMTLHEKEASNKPKEVNVAVVPKIGTTTVSDEQSGQPPTAVEVANESVTGDDTVVVPVTTTVEEVPKVTADGATTEVVATEAAAPTGRTWGQFLGWA